MPIISGPSPKDVLAAVDSVFGRTGAVVAAAGDYTGLAVGGTADALAAGALTNAMVNAGAAVAYSKLNLAGSVVNADIGAAAAIACSPIPPPQAIRSSSRYSRGRHRLRGSPRSTRSSRRSTVPRCTPGTDSRRTNASHTYKVTAFTTSATGTPTLSAGAAGTATFPPAFVRFVKV